MYKLFRDPFLIVLMFFCFNTYGQVFKSSKKIKEGIEQFVCEVKNKGNEYTNQYIQFIFKISPRYLSNDSLCYHGSYIMNSYELKSINATHFFKLNNDTILLQVSDEIYLKNFNKLNVKSFDEKTKAKIQLKLFPEKHGGFTYNPETVSICLSKKGCFQKR